MYARTVFSPAKGRKHFPSFPPPGQQRCNWTGSVLLGADLSSGVSQSGIQLGLKFGNNVTKGQQTINENHPKMATWHTRGPGLRLWHRVIGTKNTHAQTQYMQGIFFPLTHSPERAFLSSPGRQADGRPAERRFVPRLVAAPRNGAAVI